MSFNDMISASIFGVFRNEYNSGHCDPCLHHSRLRSPVQRLQRPMFAFHRQSFPRVGLLRR